MPLCARPEHVKIGLRHPGGLCGGWSDIANKPPCCREFAQHSVEPLKGKAVFCRLERDSTEDTHGRNPEVRFVHKPNFLLPCLRRPLLRVVVAPVPDEGCPGVDRPEMSHAMSHAECSLVYFVEPGISTAVPIMEGPPARVAPP